MRVCKLEASRARPSPPFLDPAIFAPLPQPALDPATLPGFSRGVSATHVGKSCGQEVRGAGPAGRPDPGEAGRSPSRVPQPQPSSRLCLVVVHALPQHTQARGTERLGCGWRHLGPGPGGDEQRGLAAEAGGCGRLGRVGGGRKKARDAPHGIPGCGKGRTATASRHWVCIRLPSWGRALEPSSVRRARRVAEGRVARQEKETQAH